MLARRDNAGIIRYTAATQLLISAFFVLFGRSVRNPNRSMALPEANRVLCSVSKFKVLPGSHALKDSVTVDKI